MVTVCSLIILLLQTVVSGSASLVILKPGRVYSSLCIHVANDLVVVEVADDIKIRPLLLLIMSLVIAKTQELTS
jgi:hypothetical protein